MTLQGYDDTMVSWGCVRVLTAKDHLYVQIKNVLSQEHQN